MGFVRNNKFNFFFFTHPNELFSVAFISKDLFWRDKEVEHKIAFYFVHGVLELCLRINIFTQKHFLLVAQTF
jgi:hypothetical protein